MRVLSKYKIQIGKTIIEPNKVVEVPDEIKNDNYFKLCQQSNYLQILESQKEEEKPKKTKKEA